MPTEVRDASGDLVVRALHTAELQPSELGRLRQLLDAAFGHDFSDQDFEHALGGVHVTAYLADELVGHAAVVARRLIYRGRALHTGYVEAVAVHPAHQRRGVAFRMMEMLEGVIERSFELGALSAADAAAALYRKRGWQLWQGPLLALTPTGTEPTPEEEGGVFVLAVGQELDVHEPLIADFRDGDVW